MARKCKTFLNQQLRLRCITTFLYSQVSSNLPQSNHILEQTLQRSYARQTGAIPGGGGGSGPARLEQQTGQQSEIVDIKELPGGNNGYRRSSYPAGGGGVRSNSSLPRIGGGGMQVAGGRDSAALQGPRVPQPDRGPSPGAGINGRVDWKAKYLQ